MASRNSKNGGSLIGERPDDLAGFAIQKAMENVPLINGLRERDQTIGLETMCVGGGQGMAMIVERLS